MYPNLPERQCHGHKFMPSWESEGQVGAEVLCHSMSSRIHSTKDPILMAYTTHSVLLRWFPDKLLGVSDFKYMSRRSGWRDVPIVHFVTRQEVLAVKHHYRGSNCTRSETSTSSLFFFAIFARLLSATVAFCFAPARGVYSRQPSRGA